MPSQDIQNKQSVSADSDEQCKRSVDSIKPESESECFEKTTEIKSKLTENECLDSRREITKNMLDHYQTLKLFGFRFTWLAIHKMYRIGLVALNTYVTDSLVRLIYMFILLIFISIINTFIKPYKTNETNLISAVSYLLNLLTAIFSVCKAVLEIFSCKTNCSSKSLFINYVEVVENALLVYVPVAMISLFMILTVLRKCRKKDKSEWGHDTKVCLTCRWCVGFQNV